jgi:hypothetical protein
MAMTGRFVDRGIRMLAAISLLLAAVSSPVRPTGASQIASPVSFLLRNFATLEVGQTGGFAISARPTVRQPVSLRSDIEDGLDADIEDELTVTSPLSSVSFDALPYHSPEPYVEFVGFPVVLAARPLRC